MTCEYYRGEQSMCLRPAHPHPGLTVRLCEKHQRWFMDRVRTLMCFGFRPSAVVDHITKQLQGGERDARG